MGAVYFYHLTRSPLEATLPMLLEKALGSGWRVVVRGTVEDRIDWLDQKLWLGPEERFLPHGRSGGAYDARQPVLLTTANEAPNDANCVMAIDGAEIPPEEAMRLDRACILFDGNDAPAVEAARAQWRRLTGAGLAAQYWSQEGGGWSKKAESGG